MDDSIYANFKYVQIICHNLEALVFDSFHKTGVKKKRMFRIKIGAKFTALVRAQKR